MITLEDVMIRHPNGNSGEYLFRDVNAAFEPGRNFGILGHKGSGKTTLIELLARTREADHGRVSHDGSVSWPLTSRRPFFRTTSIRTNIRFVAALYNSSATQLIRRVDEIVGLGPDIDVPVKELPASVCSHAIYALCLALGFDYYLADERLLIGSDSFRKQANAFLGKMRGRRSLILATRHPKFIREYCDVVYLIDRARLIRFDRPGEAIRQFKRQCTVDVGGDENF
jgi:ABC-type polysaccharide/polyol phosphate transport system ATPase subunit